MEPLTVIGIAISFFVVFVLVTACILKLSANMGLRARSGPHVGKAENTEKADTEYPGNV